MEVVEGGRKGEKVEKAKEVRLVELVPSINIPSPDTGRVHLERSGCTYLLLIILTCIYEGLNERNQKC